MAFFFILNSFFSFLNKFWDAPVEILYAHIFQIFSNNPCFSTDVVFFLGTKSKCSEYMFYNNRWWVYSRASGMYTSTFFCVLTQAIMC